MNDMNILVILDLSDVEMYITSEMKGKIASKNEEDYNNINEYVEDEVSAGDLL